eukprot:scaffold663500_cov64-Prasinocladus_malaysianus.AAC.1
MFGNGSGSDANDDSLAKLHTKIMYASNMAANIAYNSITECYGPESQANGKYGSGKKSLSLISRVIPGTTNACLRKIDTLQWLLLPFSQTVKFASATHVAKIQLLYLFYLFDALALTQSLVAFDQLMTYARRDRRPWNLCCSFNKPKAMNQRQNATSD